MVTQHSVWCREISAGTEWEPEIVRQLETSDIILLLVSAAFMNSEYCYGKELQRAIQRHERREARVIPIILSPVDWKIPPLNKLQALPTDGKPITGAGWHSVDEALLNVVKGIRNVIKDLQKRPRLGSSYQYQFGYITQQINQGNSPLAALYECDSELGKLVELVMSYQDGSNIRALGGQIEKLLQEVCDVGDDDLRVKAEVTPDTIGVLADAFNYVIEELAKVVSRIRSTTPNFTNASNRILTVLNGQKEMIITLRAELNMNKLALPDNDYQARLSRMEKIMLELYKSCDLIEAPRQYIEKHSSELRGSVSSFRLPLDMNKKEDKN